jgi:hypothetical protein
MLRASVRRHRRAQHVALGQMVIVELAMSETRSADSLIALIPGD